MSQSLMDRIIAKLLSADRYANDRLLNGRSRMTVSSESYRMQQAGSRVGHLRVILTDAVFGAGHCQRDYERITQGKLMILTTREEVAAIVVASSIATAVFLTAYGAASLLLQVLS